MNNVHLFIDAESLGSESDAILLDFSVVWYDIEKNENTTPFELCQNQSKRFKLNMQEQKEAGRFIDRRPDGALNWWKEQSEEAKEILLPSDEDLTMNEFYSALCEYIDSIDYNKRQGTIWQRGTVDIQWMDSIFKRNLGLTQFQIPLNWWRVRDIRTAIDLSGKSPKFNGYPEGLEQAVQEQFPEFIAHDSIHDCVRDIIAMRIAGYL